MKAKVFVWRVSVQPFVVSLTPEMTYAPGTWDADGYVLGSGASVSWSQVRFSDPIPELGSTIELELEPESWKVKP